MSVIKLKQSDIEKIVSNILKEGEFDDFDTKIQPEELPNDEEEMNDPEVQLALGQDENGNFYVMSNVDGDKPEIEAKTK
jgi:hypothetical protein